MHLLLSFVFFIGISFTVTAQRTCTTDDTPLSSRLYGDGGTSVDNGVQRDTLPDEVITIPVVVHVLYNTNTQNITDEQILSQITALNNDFRMRNADKANTPAFFSSKAADTRIQFCLARLDPNGKPTNGIVRKKTSKTHFMGDDGMKFTNAGGDDIWNPKQYLNIWVCNMFGRSLGYATMPGTPADKDGVVINFDVFGTTSNVVAPFDKGRTTTHEVAHWLGLKHIWGDSQCGSDDVDDTPPQKSYNFKCPVFPVISDCSEDAEGDMFMNFMDLTDDACMNMFTHGQKTKMRGLFAKDNYRNSFLGGFGCDSILSSGAPISRDSVAAETLKPSISVYPNPVQGFLTVLSQNEYTTEGKMAIICDMHGKVLYRQKLQSDKGQINVTFLSPGIYFLQVGEGADRKMHRIIKI